ncbi:MAG: hypothetical protein M3445_05840 [Actinomycetota bacterium]|nr:hypothetical protein [Actinomycetota bacterium]
MVHHQAHALSTAVDEPGLREAHVAGFSRHLSTGESHILGVPLQRTAGSEVLCDFFVEQEGGESGGSIYVA